MGALPDLLSSSIPKRVRATLALLALLVGVRPAFALPPDTWLVAIGNNRGGLGDVPLVYAERDAREIVEVLRTGGGVPSDRVRLLVDEDEAAVRRVLLEVNAAIRGVTADGPRPTALIVFYSGHADAEALHLGRSRFAMAELRALLEGSPASLRVLFVDACRSGALTRVKGVRPAPEFALQLDGRNEGEGLAIISSSAAGESSQEADRLRGSFFSHHLVSGLRGAADRDGDGRVTLGEAYAYTYAQTVRSSGETIALQHPTYAYDVKGRTDVVLTTPGLAERRTGRLRLASAVGYVVFEEKQGGPILAEVTPSRDRAVLALPEGRYFVQRREPDELREYAVRLGTGEEVDLSRLPFRSVRYDQLVRKREGARRSVHGLQLLGGVEGGVIEGEVAMPNVVLGYSLDLPWLTVGARLRGATASLVSVDGGLPSRHDELALGLLVERVFDAPWFSAGIGFTVEGVYHRQGFDSVARPVSTRQGFGPAFGLLATLERRIVGPLALHVEGGPAALLTRAAAVKNGVESGDALASTITWWLAGGLVWRL